MSANKKMETLELRLISPHKRTTMLRTGSPEQIGEIEQKVIALRRKMPQVPLEMTMIRRTGASVPVGFSNVSQKTWDKIFKNGK